MKKLIILLITLMVCTGIGLSNQDPLYSQFMTNPYLINPGLTGTFDHYQVITNNRLQWIGMKDAPVTNYISVYGPMVNQPMGLGGYIMSDLVGPSSRTSFNLSYSYFYPVMENLKVSMGLTVGVMQYKLDGLTLRESDPVYQSGETYQQFKPDATWGVYAWSTMYHVGLSLTNLFGNKLQFEQDTNDLVSRLKRHFYLHGGYNYMINREIFLEPTLVLRMVSATSPQVDINCRVKYSRRQWNGNTLWGGLSFRTNESVNVMVGFMYTEKIEVGYSYDIPINKFRKQHFGSHELMIGFKFNDIRQY